MDLFREVVQAERRIRAHVRETPIEQLSPLEGAGGARVHLKLENFQLTGSFKLRGASHKLLSLSDAERHRGVVAASSGNHGAGVACAARRSGCRALVFVPEDTPPAKMEAIAAFGAEVHRHGADCLDTEKHARSFAGRHGMVYVSPYNDPQIVAGQGTIGVELERQLPGIDALYAAVGGGGLIGGVGGYLKAAGRAVEVVACSPECSPVMHRSLEEGRIVEMATRPTLSHSTAGGIEPGSITFELCQRVVDRSLLVSEAEIEAAMRLLLDRHHMLVEGAAGVAVAGFLKDAERWHGKDVVVIVCGANVGLNDVKSLH